MATAIEFENVSKRFILHYEKSRSFQELVVNTFKRNNDAREELWALNDVSFTVERGETLGIIGENGAGKSTLLKLITRILEPTSGRIAVNGKISALIELGAGFHPDLTGRENIYLNGSILGLSKREMDSRFEEIVDFSELGRFIDVPLRHYSSGMQMRLGFAIATSVDPEILLIDEVLAVGDEAFQRKCLRKINDFKRRGKTIVFVSHNLDVVRNLCSEAIWLDKGMIRAKGATDEAVDCYLESANIKEKARLQKTPPIEVKQAELESQSPNRWGSREVEITKVEFLDEKAKPCSLFRTGDRMLVRMHYDAHQRIERPVFGVAIYRSNGTRLNGPNTRTSDYKIDWIERSGYIDYIIDDLPLLDGIYEFSAAVYDHSCTQPYDHHERLYTFRVQQGAIKERYGMLHIPCRWSLKAGSRSFIERMKGLRS